uniref:Uncharacterized protein n=1 Tax=Arundo donax TaxID=35708 RepID=A0A0A8XXZ0_ARUDO
MNYWFLLMYWFPILKTSKITGLSMS